MTTLKRDLSRIPRSQRLSSQSTKISPDIQWGDSEILYPATVLLATVSY